ncbi:tyrosine-protein kinase Srms [Capsaspora owczarzaki ATCC 30864]|uniref:TKL protein kinase n=1 Tax=Capsaspora owczarzaki (strain ATCC 30864) TaxID=595528 RepID=A0A0D2X1I0_CAPO3|nr:tyrosine-protein kinase Srms [Capsaspora owczarzaki ATCC 30864]KJE90844.1 TKL protein kinase [Capsaspora owczarzaki ATCC 30864]|eukprot:XP_004348836.2 tyrosine-protein kinase Srms [Capsaspora owczarzaki ATCC 30864]
MLVVCGTLLLVAALQLAGTCSAAYVEAVDLPTNLFTAGSTSYQTVDVSNPQCYFKGFKATYDTAAKDRNWQYIRACITKNNQEPLTATNTPNNWSGELNTYDAALSWTATTGTTLFGMASVYGPAAADRIFKTRAVPMIPEFKVAGSCVTSSAVNSFKGPLDYSCSGSFQYIGSLLSTHSNSQDDRQWYFACCVMAPKSCVQPDNFPAGSWNCNFMTVGGVCGHSCATGTRSTNSSGVITCQPTESWTSRQFSCEQINCGSPANPPNGNFACATGPAGTTYLASCSLQCDLGYQPAAPTNIICQDSGPTSGFGWTSPSSNCNLVPDYCPSPGTISNGMVSCSGLTLGSTCTYLCNQAYVIDGTAGASTTRTCAGNTTVAGKWSAPKPICVLNNVLCPDNIPRPFNGAVSCSGFSLGGVCTISCNQGYQLRGYAPLETVDSVCQSNGSWTHPETNYCDPLACNPLPTIANGGYNCQGGSAVVGSTCAPFCNTGYTLEGSYADPVYCNVSQQWNATVSAHCTIVSCPVLTLEHGAVECTGDTTNYLSVCAPRCDAGYGLAGQNTDPVRCQASGAWNATMKAHCGILACSALSLLNGSFVCSDSFNYMSQCVPHCDSGLRLAGNSTEFVTCNSSLLWAPVVSPIECRVDNSDDKPESSSASMVPAVAGSVVGGVFLLLLLVALMLVRRRRRSRASMQLIVKGSSSASLPMYDNALSHGSTSLSMQPLSNKQREALGTQDSASDLYSTLQPNNTISIAKGTVPARASSHYESDQIYDSVQTSQQYEAPAKQNGAEPSAQYDSTRMYDAPVVTAQYEATQTYDAPVVAASHKVSSVTEAADHYEPSQVYERPGPRSKSLRDNLVLGAKLGSGNFGIVVRGQLPRQFVAPDAQYLLNGLNEGANLDVAVKSLQSDANDKSRLEFVEEARMMAQFCHPNVVRYIAALLDSVPYMCVIELMPYGDLRHVLAQSKALGISWSAAEMNRALAQVALGLEYLESIRFIHRDIAARNCLVSSELTVKISDFGMSRSLAEEQDYYRMHNRGKVPVKWMAPECINYRKFSHSSDVWAFGVLAWEVFSYGASPYESVEARQLVAEIEAGLRLEQPASCPNDVYSLLLTCWDLNPLSRPAIASLRAHFESASAGHDVRDIGSLIAQAPA